MKRIYPVLSDRQLQRAHDRHVGGETWKEIAPDFRCSDKVLGEQVNRWRNRNGIARDARSGSPKAAIRRAEIDAILLRMWNNPAYSRADVCVATGLSEDTCRRYAGLLKLGRRGYTPPGYAGARPPKPSGNGGDYAGRRYEDDPRDPPTRNHIVLTGVTLPGSMMSSAAAMCAS